MSLSPFRHSLYRTTPRVVTFLALLLLFPQTGAAQYGKKKTVKGPRAIGLLQIAPNGKAHLIPIAILVDGKFYDASAYKADPVPMALESEVVYEGIRTGVSQGLFTVSGALQAQNSWLGEGTWQPAGSAPAKKVRSDEKPNLNDDTGPPKLRKQSGGSRNPSSDSQPSSAPPPPSSSPSSAPPSGATPPPPSQPKASDSTQKPAEAPAPNQSAEDDSDPNRPKLRRGKQEPSNSVELAPKKPSVAAPLSSVPAGAKAKPSQANTASIQFIPAVSDAQGPDARPYAFEMKPGEEDSYRKKMLTLAAAEVQAKARAMTPKMPGAPTKGVPARPAAKPKSTAPTFDDIQLRAFDLWNTNEPIFVMSAQAHLPPDPASPSTGPRTYTITLVARADIYLELHKLLADVTDEQHLDEFPKLELVDAVDADGDGRGDLLFREVSDAGTAWAIYKPTSDSLYPLFEGTPTNPIALPPDTKH